MKVSVDKDLLFKLISYNEDNEREDFFQGLSEGNFSCGLEDDEVELLVELEAQGSNLLPEQQKKFDELFNKAIASSEADHHIYKAIEMLRRQAMGTA